MNLKAKRNKTKKRWNWSITKLNIVFIFLSICNAVEHKFQKRAFFNTSRKGYFSWWSLNARVKEILLILKYLKNTFHSKVLMWSPQKGILFSYHKVAWEIFSPLNMIKNSFNKINPFKIKVTTPCKSFQYEEDGDYHWAWIAGVYR